MLKVYKEYQRFNFHVKRIGRIANSNEKQLLNFIAKTNKKLEKLKESIAKLVLKSEDLEQKYEVLDTLGDFQLTYYKLFLRKNNQYLGRQEIEYESEDSE